MNWMISLSLGLVGFSACGDDSSEADRRGVGSECSNNDDCTEQGQTCLPFKGGYCGVAGCVEDTDCPGGSLCVTHDDGANYCFLVCGDKADCNANRSVDNESNCVASVTFADQGSGKACVPPSGN